MNNSVADSVKKVIKENKVDKQNLTVVKGYYEAMKIYDNLVSDGLTVKRGYNLKTIECKKNITSFNTFI